MGRAAVLIGADIGVLAHDSTFVGPRKAKISQLRFFISRLYQIVSVYPPESVLVGAGVGYYWCFD